MPKFHIKSEEDLYNVSYIKRINLIKNEILFNQPRLKFIGHSYEYFKYNNVLKICGVLENGFPATLSINKIPIRLYVLSNNLKYKVKSSKDYEKYYHIDDFIKNEVTSDMCLNSDINLRKLYPDEYVKYMENYDGRDFARHINLVSYFKTYESKIEFINNNMRQYLRYNYHINETFEDDEIKFKFNSVPKFAKILERGYEYYDMHLVYEITFSSIYNIKTFYDKYYNSHTILGYKKGKHDKYILSQLAKLDIPINFWLYISNFSYTFELNGQVNFKVNVDDVKKVTDDIPNNTNNFQVFFDYETYHGGNQGLIISDDTEFCSVSFVYSWLNNTEYKEIFIMNSDKDHITDDDSYTYLCDNEYLTILCVIRVLYYLQPDYLVAFNAIDFDHLVTMVVLARYKLLAYYMNVLNRLIPVDINNYDIYFDTDYILDSNNNNAIYNISCNYKLDLKDRYVDVVHTISKNKLINNKYSNGESIKSEAGDMLRFSMVNIPGIVFIDVFLICKIKYKKEAFINPGNSLDSILTINGFNTKVQISYYIMWKIYEYIKGKYTFDNPNDHNILEDIKQNIGMYMDKWREYNNYDSIACKLILDKLKYIDQMVYEANSTYVDMYKSCYRAISSKVENLFVGVYHRDNYLIDENAKLNLYESKVDVEGARVDLMKPGLIKKAIQPIDVQSLYPSIMIALNLSYDTMQINDDEIDFILETEGLKEEDILMDLFEDDNSINAHIKELKFKINSKDPEVILNNIKSMIKYQDTKYIIIKFNFQSDHSTRPQRRMLLITEKYRQGLVPLIEIGYFNARVVIKKQLSGYKETDVDFQIINARQNAIKVIMNSIYGLLNTQSFILKNEGLANNVTLMGRHIILNVKQFCIDILDLLVVYLDTDSNYLAFKSEVFKDQKLSYKSGVMTFREYEEYIIKYTYDKMEIYIKIINEYLKYLTRSTHIRMAVEEILYPSYFKAKKNYICKKHFHGKFNSDFKVNGHNYAIKGGNQFKRDSIPILQEFIKEYIINIFSNCNRKDTISGIMKEQIIKYYERKYTPDELDKFAKVQKYNQMKNNVSIHAFIARCRDEKDKAKEEGNNELYELIPNIENSDKFKTIIVDHVSIDATGKKIKKYNSMSAKIELLEKAKYLGYRPDLISYLVKLSEYLGGFLYIKDGKSLDEIKKLTAETIRQWCGKQQLGTLKLRWKEYSYIYYMNMEKKYPGIYQSISNKDKLELNKIYIKYEKVNKIKSMIRSMPKIYNFKIPHSKLNNRAKIISAKFDEIINNNRHILDSYEFKLNNLFNEFNYGRVNILVLELSENEEKILLQLANCINEYINNNILCGMYSDKNIL